MKLLDVLIKNGEFGPEIVENDLTIDELEEVTQLDELLDYLVTELKLDPNEIIDRMKYLIKEN